MTYAPRFMPSFRQAVLVGSLATVAFATGCREVTPPPGDRAPTSAMAKAPGYLKPEERPDGIALLPPPPAAGSREAAADAASYRQMKSLEGTARWRLAYTDANLKFPAAPDAFTCALGFRVDPEAT